MKNLLKEYFYIPQHGKVREKVMLARITVSIVFIICCMAAMSITAYAFFSHGISSGYSKLESRHYDLTVKSPEDMQIQENDVYTLYNDTNEPKIYVFSVTKEQTENQVAVGYCKISVKTDINAVDIIEDVQNFYTKPIGTYKENDVEVTNNIRWVKITVAPHKTAIVKFTAEWGTCAKEPIIDETIIPIYGSSESVSVEGSDENTEAQEPDTEKVENDSSEDITVPNTEEAAEEAQNTSDDTENITEESEE